MAPGLQRTLAFAALLILSPLLAVLSIAVRLSSPGPALHRAIRTRPGGTFTLYKFRTMRSQSGVSGSSVTAAGDARVTQLGRTLRRSKLDELPQLWNVVKGDMLLVGPRPEDPRFVEPEDPLHQRVFSGQPGITGPTALAYKDEEALLVAASRTVAAARGHDRPTPDDIDEAYRRQILPTKLALDAEYLETRSTRGDLAILGRTIGQVIGRVTHR